MPLSLGDRVIIDGEPTEVESFFTRLHPNDELIDKCVLTGIMRHVKKIRDLRQDRVLGWYAYGQLLSVSMRTRWEAQIGRSILAEEEPAIWKRGAFHDSLRVLDSSRNVAIAARKADLIRFRDNPDAHPIRGKTLTVDTVARYNRQIAACDIRMLKRTGEL